MTQLSEKYRCNFYDGATDLFLDRMIRLKWLLTIAAVLCIYGCQNSKNSTTDKYYVVRKVVDGDTFWIDDGTEKGQKVRLIGVDAPETRQSSRKTTGPYGREAKHFLTSQLLENEVRLEYDVDQKDRYGRTLAYVYLRDGTFINAELVKQGYAMVMTVPPNVRYADEFVELQRAARVNGRGLWKEWKK